MLTLKVQKNNVQEKVERRLNADTLDYLTKAVLLPLAPQDQKKRLISKILHLIEMLSFDRNFETLFDSVRADAELKWCLLVIVKLSSLISEISPSSTKAISILNEASVGFSEMDLRGIRVPGANLNNVIFDKTKLANADLSSAFLSGAWLNHSDLSCATLLNVDFNEPISISVKDDISACCYSPNGNFILIASEMWLMLYDTLTLKKIRDFYGHISSIHDAAFNFSGELIVTGSGFYGDDKDNTVRIWHVSSGQEIERFCIHKEYVQCVAFSPANNLVASGDFSGGLFLSSLNNKSHFLLVGHSESVSSVTFSFNGELLVSGSSDCSVKVWDVLNRTQMQHFDSGTLIISVSIHPNAQLIAAGGRDKKIRIWNLCTRQLHFEPLEGHGWFVNKVVFSPDGQYLASGGKDGVIRLWDVLTGKSLINPLNTRRQLPVISLAFHVNQPFLISGSGTTTLGESNDIEVRFWDLSKAQSNFILSIDRARGFIRNLAPSPDGQFVIAGVHGGTGGQGVLQIWSTKNRDICCELQRHAGEVNCVAWSPDGKWIASAGYYYDTEADDIYPDTNIRIWDATTGQLIKKLGRYFIEDDVIEMHSRAVTALVFASHSQFLVSASDDDTVRLWQIESGIACRLYSDFANTNRRYKAEKAVGVKSVAYSSDDKFIAAANADGIIRLWNAFDNKEKFRFVGHEHAVTLVKFSADDKMLVSSSYDDTIRLWNTDSGEQISVLQQNNIKWGLGGFASKIVYTTSVVFSPDETYIITGHSENGFLAVRNISTHAVVFFTTLNTSITSLGWCGNLLLVGGTTISYWQYKNNELVLVNWPGGKSSLYATNCNIENVTLSQRNSTLLLQYGAMQSHLEAGIDSQEKTFLSMSLQQLAEKLLRDTIDQAIVADDLYFQLIKKAIRLKVHFTQDRESNTALHLAIITKQFAKVLFILKAVAQYDERLTMALDISNCKKITSFNMLTGSVFTTLEYKKFIDIIVCRKVYFQLKSEVSRGSLRKTLSCKDKILVENQQELFLYRSLREIVNRHVVPASSLAFFSGSDSARIYTSGKVKCKTTSGWKKGFLNV